MAKRFPLPTNPEGYFGLCSRRNFGTEPAQKLISRTLHPPNYIQKVSEYSSKRDQLNSMKKGCPGTSQICHFSEDRVLRDAIPKRNPADDMCSPRCKSAASLRNLKDGHVARAASGPRPLYKPLFFSYYYSSNTKHIPIYQRKKYMYQKPCGEGRETCLPKQNLHRHNFMWLALFVRNGASMYGLHAVL